MTLTGQWTASNGNVDIFIIQTGVTVLVHWTQDNPYWNYAAGTTKDNSIKMTFGGSDQDGGTISSDGNTINWDNGSSWSRA